MLDGTVTAEGLLLNSVITSPLALVGAAVSETVSTPGPDVKISVLGESVIPLEDAVIVTVCGRLARNPSFTINCATYTPATSATNVGDTVVAACSFALLPVGALSSDQL